MRNETEREKTDSRAHMKFFGDGLWDIYLGLLMLAMAINAFIEAGVYFYIVLFIPALFIILAGKIFITKPRMGMVTAGSVRTVNKKGVLAVIVLVVLLNLLIYLSMAIQVELPEWSFIWYEGNGFPLLIGWILILLFCSIAYWLNYNRLYFIGAVYALTIPAAMLFSFPFLFFVSAFLILIPGIVSFLRFLNKYRVPSNGRS